MSFSKQIPDAEAYAKSITDWNKLDEQGLTSLHVAALSGSVEAVKASLKAGANVDAKNARGQTPLLQLAYHRSNLGKQVEQNSNLVLTNLIKESNYFNTLKEIIKILLENNANPNARARSTALEYIAETNDLHIAELLLKHGADIDTKMSPVFVAIMSNQIEMLKLLIKYGADVNKNYLGMTEVGEPAIYIAIISDKPEAVKVLIENGADVNVTSGSINTAPLIYVTMGYDKKNAIEIARMLIEAGADIHKKDKEYGRTALLSASLYKFKEMIVFLLSKGGNINDADNDGKTSLHHSAVYGMSVDIVELLIKNGADITIKDKANKTALDYAREQQAKYFKEVQESKSENDYIKKLKVRLENFKTIIPLLEN